MKKTIESYDLKNKTVIIRADLNVPIKEGKIKDNSRILASVKTIKYALDKGAKVVVLSHLGRVKNEIDKAKNGLRPVYEELNKLLDGKLRFTAFTRGAKVEAMVKDMPYGQAILLENTRFEDIEGEKESKNDPELAESWAKLGELFINDAFGTLHREHASNVGLAKLLPSGLGFLVVKELNELDKLDNPERPFAIIMGGAKVSDKLGVIKSLITKADKMLIGGGMAFTFLKAKGVEIGKSLVEDEYLDYCKELLKEYGNKIILPVDYKVAHDTEDVMPMITDSIGMYQMGLDIGPKTIKLFQDELKGVKTCFWNGPLGMYENPNYQEGTKMVLDYIAKSDMYSILGGGDIVTCANQFGYSDNVSFLSTGGGASLEYLENKDLPGLRYISEE
jgi:phosphoglycerate kinase